LPGFSPRVREKPSIRPPPGRAQCQHEEKYLDTGE
jgi:hypothetical protein